MSNDWNALDAISDSGFYAVVVTAEKALVPVASGYARAISVKTAATHSEHDFIGLRLNQLGSPEEDQIDEADVNALASWVDGNAHNRRSGNKPSSGIVVYVERFDRIPDSAISLLKEAEELNLNVILIGAVDVALPPAAKALNSFDTVRIINIPSKPGEAISTAEKKLK